MNIVKDFHVIQIKSHEKRKNLSKNITIRRSWFTRRVFLIDTMANMTLTINDAPTEFMSRMYTIRDVIDLNLRGKKFNYYKSIVFFHHTFWKSRICISSLYYLIEWPELKSNINAQQDDTLHITMSTRL